VGHYEHEAPAVERPPAWRPLATVGRAGVAYLKLAARREADRLPRAAGGKE
jgi:hypothetical protein